jgi:hypothetical protein
LKKQQTTWPNDEPTSQFDVSIHLAMLLRIHSHPHNGQTADGPSTRLTKFFHIPILRILGLSLPDPQRLLHGPLLLHDKLPNINPAKPLALHILHASNDQPSKGPPIHSLIPTIHAKRRLQLRIPRVPLLPPPILPNHTPPHPHYHLYPTINLIPINSPPQPIAPNRRHK